jgi:hypothetical protein
VARPEGFEPPTLRSEVGSHAGPARTQKEKGAGNHEESRLSASRSGAGKSFQDNGANSGALPESYRNTPPCAHARPVYPVVTTVFHWSKFLVAKMVSDTIPTRKPTHARINEKRPRTSLQSSSSFTGEGKSKSISVCVTIAPIIDTMKALKDTAVNGFHCADGNTFSTKAATRTTEPVAYLVLPLFLLRGFLMDLPLPRLPFRFGRLGSMRTRVVFLAMDSAKS